MSAGAGRRARKAWPWLFALAGVLLCLTQAQAQGSSSPDRPTSITVAIDDNYPPYIFRGANGELLGILKDTWDAWSRVTGIPVEIRATDWAVAQNMMQTGEADVIDTMFKTPERQKTYDFSAPYATIGVPIFFHNTISGISDAETLRGFTVGVKDGDACISWLERNGITTLKRYPSYEAMVDAAERNELRIFCMDQPPGDYFLYKKGLDTRFRQTPPLYSGQFHWAVRKGERRLYALIEDGFRGIGKEERERIQTHWMGSSLVRGDSRYVGIITVALELAGAGALLLGMSTWVLRRQVAQRTRQVSAALDALTSSEQHYRELVSLTPVGVFEVDVDGNYTFVNERWSRISGLAGESARGRRWTDCLHPEDAERVWNEWRAVCDERVLFQSEFRFPGLDGQVTWVLGLMRIKRDVVSVVTGHIGTVTDISASKAAEAALAASESRFRTIFDSISDAIFIHDMESGRILAVNQRMLEMYGYDDLSQVVGLHPGALSEGKAPYDDDHARQMMAKAGVGEPQLYEWRARARDGRLFWVEVTMRRARIAGIERLLVLVHDITERKAAEQILTERTEALERSNADLEQFAYVASHDLREPLRMVSSYMALLERRYGDLLDKDGHDFINFAKEGAIRMDRLVQDLLEFSRVGRISDPPAEISLDLVVGNVTRVLRSAIAEAHAEVRVPSPLPTVVCCGNEIFLLFQNLISNAVKFRAPDRSPVVTITAAPSATKEGLWQITVADNGIGIDPPYFDRIFKIFHRLHSRDKYDGTGIGLSVCKKVVERHGGRIWVESVEGEGARFIFTLGDLAE